MGKFGIKTFFSNYVPDPFMPDKNEELYHQIFKDYIAEKSSSLEVVPIKNNKRGSEDAIKKNQIIRLYGLFSCLHEKNIFKLKNRVRYAVRYAIRCAKFYLQKRNVLIRYAFRYAFFTLFQGDSKGKRVKKNRKTAFFFVFKGQKSRKKAVFR